jgi:short-subunit dehydrogenase
MRKYDGVGSLEGRTALVAGNSRSIGVPIVSAFCKERLNLVLAAPSAHDIDQMLAAVCSARTKVLSLTTDFGNPNAITSLVDRAVNEFGSVDILVNNSILETIYPYHIVSLEEIDHALRVSLTAAMLLTSRVLPFMLQRHSGHIVNICSLAGKTGPPCSEVYSAANAGLIAFTKSLRLEYRNSGISASTICPGFIDNKIYRHLRDATRLEAPGFCMCSLEQIGEAVVKAIKQDIPEIIVGARRARLLTILAELSPRTGERIMQKLGVAEWFKQAGDSVTSEKTRFSISNHKYRDPTE